MIREMVMPQLAMGMSEGTIVNWIVSEGDYVERESPLLSIETEKVVTDLPSPYRGYVHLQAVEGDTVPVEVPIASFAETQEEYQALIRAQDQAPGGADSVAVVTDGTVTMPETGASQQRPRPASGRIRASGLAKKIASQHGLDLSSVIGTGPAGRIVRRDVLMAIDETGRQAPADLAAMSPTVDGMLELTRVPISGARKEIADRLLKSKTTSAHTYAFFEIDITKLLEVRRTLLEREEELGGRISMISLYTKALAIALQHVPICNATVADDEIIVWKSVNVGIAVALPGKTEFESGLLVPVVRNAEGKGVLQIDREIKDLVTRAKSGRLAPQEMTRGTVTISSTAGFGNGIWAVSTPLLNQPQVLNFQPGTPLEKPVVVDGEITARSMLPCGLSFDHRAMDGEPVGRFIRKIVDLMSNPELMVL